MIIRCKIPLLSGIETCGKVQRSSFKGDATALKSKRVTYNSLNR